MLPINNRDRVRILAAVADRGTQFQILRVVIITISLLILLLVPLLEWVRIDLWRGDHRLLGEPVNLFTALKGFVVSMAVIYGFTFLSNTFVGRFFCGWGCPVGFTSRLGESVARMKSRLRRWVAHGFGAAFVATFVGSVMLWWVDPRVFLEGSWQARLITTSVFVALWVGGFLHAFRWRFGFCVSVCPIGLYYRYVTSSSSVSIVFNENPSPCLQCHACETICPVALDPKALGQMTSSPTDADAEPERYGDAECLRCGDCVAACHMVFLKHSGTPPLRFGRAKSDQEHPPVALEAARDLHTTIEK